MTTQSSNARQGTSRQLPRASTPDAARSGGPELLSAAEVAERLQCSPWWVKEQARKRRIPFSWIGGSYRFTSEHLAEIIRVFEVRPGEATTVLGKAAPRRGRASRRPSTPPPDPATRLTARPPRRGRASSSQDSAA